MMCDFSAGGTVVDERCPEDIPDDVIVIMDIPDPDGNIREDDEEKKSGILQ